MSTTPLSAVEQAVASVVDPTDADARAAAVLSISPAMIDDIMFGDSAGTLGAAADGRLLAIGVPASPGLGIGRVITDPGLALDVFEAGTNVILVLDETTPADEPAMRVAAAIVTRRGGVASHAGIIARQWGVPAVCGVGDLPATDGAQWVVDGGTGEVRSLDAAPIDESTLSLQSRPPMLAPALETLLQWADEIARPALQVHTNAEDPETIEYARLYGAAGVGLCRTEHQFLGSDAALLGEVLRTFTPSVPGGDVEADAEAKRAELLYEFAARQRSAMILLLNAVGTQPVVVRLLDAPASEFGVDEHNPMLGVRGVRFGLLYRQVLEAQIEAIAHAYCDVFGTAHPTNAPRLTLSAPMVSMSAEVAEVKTLVDDTAFRVGIERGTSVTFSFGAMIETPRAALCASAFARHVTTISFGTNDLTQFTYGLSRDDSSAMIAAYQRDGLIDRDPFRSIDPVAVARLIVLAVETSRTVNPDAIFTLCGEHAADPASIALAYSLGISTLSVSPFNVPTTRLAAAHAVLGAAR